MYECIYSYHFCRPFKPYYLGHSISLAPKGLGSWLLSELETSLID